MTVIAPGEMATDHAALIEAIALRGDRAAFATLFRYFAPRVKAYLRRLGASDAVAEELAQEAMLSVWRKADRYDPGKASASTWIFTIARNLRIDWLRREVRPDLDPEDPVLVPPPPTMADHTVEAAQRDGRVRRALETLPGDQAEVVRLAFFEDLTHADVALKLGIPLGTVKSRLRLALAKVRGHVGDELS